MDGPELRRFPDAGAMTRAAAGELARRAGAAPDRFTVALSGGSTPGRLFELLAQPDPALPEIPWERIHLFWGDERHVPPDHPDSNYGLAHDRLLSRVPIRSAQIHRIRGEIENAEAAALAYEEELRGFFGGEDTPRFDLVFLGMGSDGHTASLFPGNAALDETRRWVAAPWVEKLGVHRITLTLPVLNHAACVVFMVHGVEKADMVRAVLEGESALPAGRVRPVSGALLWLVDETAAGALGTLE